MLEHNRPEPTPLLKLIEYIRALEFIFQTCLEAPPPPLTQPQNLRIPAHQ